MTVAALYVLSRGPYADMTGVDPWPERRNALLYRGSYPVVAFPPCAQWSPHVNQAGNSEAQHARHGPFAALQVQRCGGALEHPAGSRLWDVMELPRPDPYRQRTFEGPRRDAFGGFTVELDLSAFGLRCAHKRTWVYFVGVEVEAAHRLPPCAATPKMPKHLLDKVATWKPKIDERPGRKPGSRSFFDAVSGTERKRSPVAFAKWIVALAETVNLPPGSAIIGR